MNKVDDNELANFFLTLEAGSFLFFILGFIIFVIVIVFWIRMWLVQTSIFKMQDDLKAIKETLVSEKKSNEKSNNPS